MPYYKNPEHYLSYNWDANLTQTSSSFGYYFSFPSMSNLRNLRSGTAWYWNEQGLLQESKAREPRFDWNPMPDGSVPNMPDILLEEASTNLANDRLASSGTTSWIRTSLISSNATNPSPDGRRNGITLIPSTSAPQPASNQYLSRQFTVASNTKSWFSFYVKPTSWNQFGVEIIDNTGTLKTIEISYDLDNMTATQLSAEAHFIEAEIQPCPNNWYRLIMGFNTSSMTDIDVRVGYRQSSGGAMGTVTYLARALFWGFQLENVNLNHATSVIWNDTTGTLSRIEDRVETTTLSSLRGYSAGVFGFRYKLFDAHTSAFNRTFGFGNLTTNNFIGLKIQTDNRPFAQIKFNGTTEFFRQPTAFASGNPKQWVNIAIGHQLNRAQMWINGVRIQGLDFACPLFNSGDYPSNLLLDDGGSSTRFFGRIQFVRVWLTDFGSELLDNDRIDKLCYDVSFNPNKINPWTT